MTSSSRLSLLGVDFGPLLGVVKKFDLYGYNLVAVHYHGHWKVDRSGQIGQSGRRHTGPHYTQIASIAAL